MTVTQHFDVCFCSFHSANCQLAPLAFGSDVGTIRNFQQWRRRGCTGGMALPTSRGRRSSRPPSRATNHSATATMRGSTPAAGDDGGASSRLRHQGSDPPAPSHLLVAPPRLNKRNTLWAFNVFNEGISYCDWKQNVPDSHHVGVADRQKLARLIWLVRGKNSPVLFPPLRGKRYRRKAFCLVHLSGVML